MSPWAVLLVASVLHHLCSHPLVVRLLQKFWLSHSWDPVSLNNTRILYTSKRKQGKSLGSEETGDGRTVLPQLPLLFSSY